MWWVRGIAIIGIVLTCACGAEPSAGSPETHPATHDTPPPAQPAAPLPDDGTEGEGDTIPDGPPPLFDPNEPPASRLSKEASRIVADAKVTKYSHRTVIDETKGTFDV